MIWQNLLNVTALLKNFSHVHLGQRFIYLVLLQTWFFPFPPSSALSFLAGSADWAQTGGGTGQGTVSQEAGVRVCNRCVLGFFVTVPPKHEAILQGVWTSSILQGTLQPPGCEYVASHCYPAPLLLCISSFFCLLFWWLLEIVLFWYFFLLHLFLFWDRDVAQDQGSL